MAVSSPTPPAPQPPLLEVFQVGHRLGVGQESVRRLLREGKLTETASKIETWVPAADAIVEDEERAAGPPKFERPTPPESARV
jgi:hypothetical protein